MWFWPLNECLLLLLSLFYASTCSFFFFFSFFFTSLPLLPPPPPPLLHPPPPCRMRFEFCLPFCVYLTLRIVAWRQLIHPSISSLTRINSWVSFYQWVGERKRESEWRRGWRGDTSRRKERFICFVKWILSLSLVPTLALQLDWNICPVPFVGISSHPR